MKYRALGTLLFLPILYTMSANASSLATARDYINTKRFSEAATLLGELHDSGDARAGFHLAGLYARGQGVTRDAERARELYVLASEGGDADATEVLRVQWPNSRDSYRQTLDPDAALRVAAMRDWAQDIDELIAAGTDVDASDTAGRSALLIAAEFGNERSTTQLIKARANLDHKDAGGETALLKAIRGTSSEVFELLLNAGADPEQADEHGNTPLHFAVRYQRPFVVQRLLADDVNNSRENAQGMTPLSLAKRHVDADIRSLLLAADATAPSIQAASFGRSLFAIDRPLNGAALWFIAAERGSTATLAELLKNGANVNRSNANGTTALMLCAARGYAQCVKSLLRAGAKTQLRDQNQDTALLQAVRASELETAELMLGRKFDVQELAAAAIASGSVAVLRWALTHGAPLNGSLVMAANAGQQELITELIAKGAAIDTTDPFGRTALWICAGRGMQQAADALLDAGATASASDAYGNSALHQAAALGQSDIVARLLQAGAKADGVNNQGMTPLMLATTARHFGVIERLYLAKVDFDQINNDGQTALMLAAFRNDPQAAGLLLDYGANASVVNKNRRNAADIAIRLGNSDVIDAIENH